MQSRSVRGLMAVALCLVMSGCTYSLKEAHLVRPMPAPPPDLAVLAATHAGYTATESRIDTPDDVSIYRVDLKRDDARATVLYFGGNGFRTGLHARRIFDAYAGLPVDLVLVDHRGYGASTGTPTIDGLRADALQVYDQVRAETTGRPLIVHGQSLGSFFAGYVAESRQLDGLVLESSMTTAEDWTRAMRARAGFWTRLAVRRFDIAPALQKTGNLEVARRLDAPVLYVVGELDVTTAPKFSQALFDATPLPAADRQLVIVPGRGHNDAALSPEFEVAFTRLLERTSAD